MSLWVLCILYILSSFSFVERIWNTFNDYFTYKLQYKENRHNDDIVIVKIDDKTFESLWKSDLGIVSFDKGVYADFIEKVFNDYDAATLWIDIVFANPSVLGLKDEQKLADVLAVYRDKVVIATTSDLKPRPLCLYSNARHGAINMTDQDVFREFSVSWFTYDLRRECPETKDYMWESSILYSFPREILSMHADNTDPFSQQKISENLEIFTASSQENSYVDYYSNGKDNTGIFWYQSYSFIDIYRWLMQTQEWEKIDLDGKIVLLWEVWKLIHDSHFTPVHQNVKMPGVEINANIITTMLMGRNLQDTSSSITIIIFLLFQICIITSVLYSRVSIAFWVLILSSWILIVLWGWMFSLWYILNTFLWIIGCFMSLLLAYIYRFKVTDKSKRLLKRQFSSYVSPDVVEEISQNPDSVLVRWEKRNMTMFFSDIVSFTGISESTAPEVVVEILNEYFAHMTKIIYDNKGTLDKYIWDAVMCFFNAPLRQDNHSYFACKTALEQQKRLRELNLEWQKKKYPEIKIRIWVHTWEAIHGNIGSSDTRVNYTVIGDSVNLASRLEWICKKYGISICVSREVYELQKSAFHFRELDAIEVKGRQEPVRIYQLISDKKHNLSPRHLEYLDRYHEALRIYREEKYSQARELFLQNIGDRASEIMWDRCKDILEGKSTVKQGVFKMLTK